MNISNSFLIYIRSIYIEEYLQVKIKGIRMPAAVNKSGFDSCNNVPYHLCRRLPFDTTPRLLVTSTLPVRRKMPGITSALTGCKCSVSPGTTSQRARLRRSPCRGPGETEQTEKLTFQPIHFLKVWPAPCFETKERFLGISKIKVSVCYGAWLPVTTMG